MKIVGEFSCDATHILVPLRQRQESRCRRLLVWQGHRKQGAPLKCPGKQERQRVLFVMNSQEFTKRQLNFQMRTPLWGQSTLNWGAYFAFSGSFHLSFLIMPVTYYGMWVVMVMWGQEPSALQNLRKLYRPHNVGKKKEGGSMHLKTSSKV